MIKNHYIWKKSDADGVFVYEGKHAMSVGNGHPKDKQMVFAEKKGLRILKKGSVGFWSQNEYLGEYDKNKAASLVRTIDKRLEDKGVSMLGVDKKPDRTAFVYSFKKNRPLIVYDRRYPEDIIHEMAHIKLGHMNHGRPKRHILTEEKDAVALEISELKRRGKYNKKVRRRIIDSLGLYAKDRSKALKFVRMTESR